MRRGTASLSGEVSTRVIPAFPGPGLAKPTVAQVLALAMPRVSQSKEVREWKGRNLRNVQRGIRDVFWANRFRGHSLLGLLYLAKIDRYGNPTHLGLASCQVVTTAYAELIVDRLVASGNLNTHNFHGIGTGGTAEAIGDTALVTELTTQYQTDNTRATGSQAENTSVIYRTIGTNTVDATVAITEHGIFDNATVGSGILMDRSLFSAVNLVSGESIQSTYDLTITAGG